MIGENILFVGLSLALAQAPPAATSQPTACSQVLADAAIDAAAGEICAGDEAIRLANAASRDSAEQARQWDAAARHYRKAATLALKDATKLLALNSLTTAYDTQHLNDPGQMEAVLREIIRLTPDDRRPVFRLAKLEEDQGLIDAAEDTLLGARHRQPDEVEPNRMLAQFYARRVTALNNRESQKEPPAASNPGEPDEHGIYRVGGPIARPARDLFGARALRTGFDFEEPLYPPEALAAGIEGAVVAEVVMDTSGDVTDAKVIQSIPLLDEAALEAVRHWHFAPTVVNGEAVPARMNVTVNFSLPSPAQTPPRR